MNLRDYSKRNFKRHLLYLFYFTLFTYPLAFMKLEILNRPLPVYIIVLYLLMFITIYDWKPVQFISVLASTKGICGFFLIVLMASVVSIYFDALRLWPMLIALSYIIIPVVVPEIIESERMFEKIIRTMAAALVLIVAYGYFGFLTHKTGQASEHQLFYWGIRYTAATRNSDVLFPILLSFFVFSFIGFKRLTIPVRSCLFLVLLLSITAIVLSQSRSGWLAFMAGAVYIIFQWVKSKKWQKKYQNIIGLYAFCILGILSAVWLIEVVPESIKSLLMLRIKSIFSLSGELQGSNIERLKIIESALLQIIKNPIGVGWSNATHYLAVEGVAHHAENAYLNVLVETGWIGFGFFLYIVFFPLKYNWACLKNEQISGWYQIFIVSSNIMMAVYFLFNTEVYNIFIWALIGLNFCPVNIYRKKRSLLTYDEKTPKQLT